MCGIVGYIGDKKAQPILLNSLGKMEYRGYDSCGIAVANGGIEIYKDVVRVKALTEMLKPHDGRTGIGHTRWATLAYSTPRYLSCPPSYQQWKFLSGTIFYLRPY